MAYTPVRVWVAVEVVDGGWYHQHVAVATSREAAQAACAEGFRARPLVWEEDEDVPGVWRDSLAQFEVWETVAREQGITTPRMGVAVAGRNQSTDSHAGQRK
jgi:hypothetical protein